MLTKKELGEIIMEFKRELIGNAIRKTRIERGLSQEELAEMVDITPTHMKHIESGHRLPSVEVLYQIVVALRMSLDSVFFPENAANSELYEKVVFQLGQCDEHQLEILYATVNAMLETKQ